MLAQQGLSHNRSQETCTIREDTESSTEQKLHSLQTFYSECSTPNPIYTVLIHWKKKERKKEGIKL